MKDWRLKKHLSGKGLRSYRRLPEACLIESSPGRHALLLDSSPFEAAPPRHLEVGGLVFVSGAVFLTGTLLRKTAKGVEDKTAFVRGSPLWLGEVQVEVEEACLWQDLDFEMLEEQAVGQTKRGRKAKANGFLGVNVQTR